MITKLNLFQNEIDERAKVVIHNVSAKVYISHVLQGT